MSTPPKTRPKKLRGQDKTIAVDEQIIAWRKKLKKQGLKLGRHMDTAEKNATRAQLDRDIKSGTLKTKKWF